MTEINDEYYRNITIQMDEKPSIEETQLSRKQRYFQRGMKQKKKGSLEESPEREIRKITRSSKRLVQEVSSDDEMPLPTPKTQRKTVTAKQIIEIFIDDDVEMITSSKQIDNSDDCNVENEAPMEVEQRTKRIIIYPTNPLRGRLPTWYYTKKAKENEEKLKRNAKKEARLKIEKEMSDKQKKEEEAERRKERRLLQKPKRTNSVVRNKAKQDENGNETEKVEKKDGESEKNDGEPKKKSRRAPKHKITVSDPSLNPSAISLDAPEQVPWAKRKAPQRIVTEISTTSSSASENQVFTEIPTTSSSASENQNDPNSLDNLFGSVDVNDILSTGGLDKQLQDFNSIGAGDGGFENASFAGPSDPFVGANTPLLFEENDEFLTIPDEQLQEIDGSVIDMAFLSIMNDDSFTSDPVHAFISSHENSGKFGENR